MSGLFSELGIDVTPQLRTFLRAELAQVVHYETSDGELWNPHKIAVEIRNNPDISGTVSDDTITRFLKDPTRHRTRRAAIEAIAGFLLAFEFIAPRDLKSHSLPVYERAASALADLYAGSIDQTLTRTVLGSYRSYRLMGRDRIVEWTMGFGSPDDGHSIAIQTTASVASLDDPDYVLEETENLDPRRYDWLREELQLVDREVEAAAPGVSVVAPAVACAIVGGDQYALQGVLEFAELHWKDGEIAGLRMRWSQSPRFLGDTAPRPAVPRATDLAAARRHFDWLELYPQGKAVERLPVFDPSDAGAPYETGTGRELSFQGAADGKMDEKDKTYLEGEQQELEADAALAECADETERLALAIDLWRVDHALAAIEAGADVNALHEKRRLPMVHAAASLGMHSVISAMRAKDVDLTVRDRFDRLPSACTGETDGTIALRDELAAAQAEQFKAKGLDPRRPRPPEYE